MGVLRVRWRSSFLDWRIAEQLVQPETEFTSFGLELGQRFPLLAKLEITDRSGNARLK